MKKRLFLIMILVGFVGWVGWFLPLPLYYVELPNSQRRGIALNSQGGIYCGSDGYGGRIQEYTNNGEFVRAYPTHGGRGRGTFFDFYVDSNDCLSIRVFGYQRDHKGSYCKLRVYDRSGNLIWSERRTSPTANFYYDVGDSVRDPEGNTYTFKGILFPRVVKRTQAGTKTIIIGTPIWAWPFQAPLPAFALMAIPALLGLLKAYKAGRIPGLLRKKRVAVHGSPVE